uniref:peptidoglycan lytic exotransglycosylase n=1 Tax=uncultured Alphaproteobacteria bacterium TaxID=91750 RepID=A0A6M4NMQ2_9PROT|nr:murein transglycosylase [uncultured Alphaproteobacteria bacterium]
MKKFIFLIVFLLTACPQKKEPKPSELSTPSTVKAEIQAAAFDELDGWKTDNLTEMLPTLQNNCRKISKTTTDWLGSSALKVDAGLYRKICEKFEQKQFAAASDLRKFIESNFTPFLVLDDGNAEGKFTSYYESQINASFHKHGKYQYPVYGKPYDLVEINLKDFDENLPNKRLVGRIDKQKMIPYFKRAEIENNGIKAPVLMWGDNLTDIHIMQIQGSAVAHMDNGEKIRVGYADNNGLPFRGIGSILLQNKLLAPNNANMIEIKKWLNQNPEEAKKYMQQNQRYIFHRIVNETGPVGAFGVPLQGGRSMAVDKDIIPLGSLMWLSTQTPDGKALNKLVAAQDIGSAIKGAVRGDYFWGSGGDDVLAAAGSMNSVGRYYILIPKGQRDGLD